MDADLYAQKEHHRAVGHIAVLWLVRCHSPLEAIAALYEYAERPECMDPHQYRAAADLIDTSRAAVEGVTLTEMARRLVESIDGRIAEARAA
jgi:hypothetical protein